MAMKTTDVHGDPKSEAGTSEYAKYIAAGPPSREELEHIIDAVPPAPSSDEYVPDEPGEPGWPAQPVAEYHGDDAADAVKVENATHADTAPKPTV